MPELTSALLRRAEYGADGNATAWPAGAEALHLDAVRTVGQLRALEAEWMVLFEACRATATVFQSHAWARLCADGWDRQARLHVLTARRAGRLVAVAPLALERHLGLLSLRWLGGNLAIYGDVLAEPGVDVGDWLVQALGDQALRGAQCLRLDNVRCDALIAPFLDGRARKIADDNAPWLDLASVETFEDWRKSQSRSTRKSRARRLRDLEAKAPVSFAFVPAEGAGRARVEQLFAMKRAWMEARAVVSRSIGDPTFEALVGNLAVAPGTDARISTLSLDGRPIAIELGFVSGSRYLSYLGAYDPAYSDYSPGALQLERTLEACFADGLEVFDLLPPQDPYKAGWATAQTTVTSYALPLTSLGRLHHSFARLDPVRFAKATVHRVPAPVRRALQPLVRRSPLLLAGVLAASSLRKLLLRAFQVLAVATAAWAVVAE